MLTLVWRSSVLWDWLDCVPSTAGGESLGEQHELQPAGEDIHQNKS